jgi:hypothetical protein
MGQSQECTPSRPEIQIIGFTPMGEQVIGGSPFVGKLEMMLRIAGLPYVGYLGSPADKKLAPKGKVCATALCAAFAHAGRPPQESKHVT